METIPSNSNGSLSPNESTKPDNFQTATIEVHGTGLNAHSQLGSKTDGHNKNVYSPRHFIGIPSTSGPLSILSTWSSTHITAKSYLFNNGLAYTGAETQIATLPDGSEPQTLTAPFGDHDGILGCLDTEGRLWLENPNPDPSNPPSLTCASVEGSPRLHTVALAGNGAVAITFLQSPNAGLTHITTFASFPAFSAWYQDPANEAGKPADHFMLRGKTSSLVAGTAVFLCLMESGQVYSWGDPRHRTLGRAIAEAPAEKPEVAEAVGGLAIAKVACGGWISGALSRDGALYLWGLPRMPGSQGLPGEEGSKGIRCLREPEEEGEVVLVDIAGEGGEPLDVLDFGIGSGHVVVLTDGNRVFAVGENGNGQLGLGENAEKFVEDWTEVSDLSAKVTGITCGPKTTIFEAIPLLEAPE